MYHYDPATALEELTEEAILPNPVRVRDMILRQRLTPEHSLEMNRLAAPSPKLLKHITSAVQYCARFDLRSVSLSEA